MENISTVKSTDLINVEALNPAEVFKPGGVDAIIERVMLEVGKVKTDISTASGREQIRSLAYKVARSKTALDDMGKALVAEIKARSAMIDADRKRIRDRLDELRNHVRSPLTIWENAEKDRVAGHEAELARIAQITRFDTSEPSAKLVGDRIAALAAMPPREWHEFSQRAASAIELARVSLSASLELAIKREAERAELDRLRKEVEARAQRDREEQIARDAAEKARADAEAKAAHDATVAKRAAEEKLEAERKAREAAEIAAKRAAEEKEAAIKRERERVEAERKAEEAAAAAREADKSHRAKINNAAADAIAACGVVGREQAAAIVVAIARGAVPHVAIRY